MPPPVLAGWGFGSSGGRGYLMPVPADAATYVDAPDGEASAVSGVLWDGGAIAWRYKVSVRPVPGTSLAAEAALAGTAAPGGWAGEPSFRATRTSREGDRALTIDSWLADHGGYRYLLEVQAFGDTPRAEAIAALGPAIVDGWTWR